MSDEPLTEAVLAAALDGAARMVELVNRSAVSTVDIKLGALSLRVERADAGAAEAIPAAEQVPATTPGVVSVSAPLVGVFYRCPAPGKPPFVEIGDQVEAGSQIAIVEAMKYMNPVIAEHSGVVTAVHADDRDVVEFGQPLISIATG
jgi:acetyl-CoA carboxylase biotin carboxyl carrier protein